MTAPAFDNIRIVLVNTTHPGNIGGAARAMKNMGLKRLYLVAPKDFPAEEAVWRAAGALDVLENAVVVETLEEAIQDCGLVIGTSARGLGMPWPFVDPRASGEPHWHEAQQHQVALLFGREDRGLTNDELHKCQYHVHIPSNPEYSSLNLAAAVQVLSYEIRMAHLAQEQGTFSRPEPWNMPRALSQAALRYYLHLQECLHALGFLSPANPRKIMTRLLRLYNCIRTDEMELCILRAMRTAIQNYIYYTNI